jgi:hypothetical protein
VVQISDPDGLGECRTRNLEIISGERDLLVAGKVAMQSPLGKVLCESSIEDCFQFRIDGSEWAVTVVAIRRAS